MKYEDNMETKSKTALFLVNIRVSTQTKSISLPGKPTIALKLCFPITRIYHLSAQPASDTILTPNYGTVISVRRSFPQV